MRPTIKMRTIWLLLVCLSIICLADIATESSFARMGKFSQATQPISKNSILEYLNELNEDDEQDELIELIEKVGVNFKLTTKVETELREAGAQDELIEAIKGNYKSVKQASTQGSGTSVSKSLLELIAKEGLGTLNETIKAKSKKKLYSPPAADGRTGRFAFYNGLSSPVTVHLIHPDYPDKIYHSQEVPPKANNFIGNFTVGNNWGLRIGDSKVCVVGLNEVSDWYPDKNIFNSGDGRCK